MKYDIKMKSNERDDDGLSHHMNVEDERKKSLEESIEEEARTECQRRDARKTAVNKAIDSNAVVSIMLLATTCILYGDDIRVLLSGTDQVFYVLASLVLVLFITEMAMLCWCKEKYLKRPDFGTIKHLITLESWSDRESVLSWLIQLGNAAQIGSFYFWLDLLSALSIVIGILWLTRLEGDDPGDIDSTSTDKVTMAGENATRVIRMVRLVRLAKFFKYFSTDNNSSVSRDVNVESESHVGAEMFDRTTKKVVVGIFFMLLGIPLMQSDKAQYLTKFSMKMAFEHRKWISANGIDESDIKQLEFAESLLIGRTHCIDVMYIGFNETVQLATFSSGRSKIQELEDEALDFYTITDIGYVRSMTAVFDATEKNREEAFLGALLTSFVIALLGLAILSFNQDIHVLVIMPIEHMMILSERSVKIHWVSSFHSCLTTICTRMMAWKPPG